MRILIILATAATVIACTTSPLGRQQLRFFPEDQMAEMGAAAFQQTRQEVPAAKDPRLTEYVNCVAQAVTRVVEQGPQSWDVAVFQQDEINAFALPGGKIGVYTGLLDVAKTPDQLAAVIGHEVAHVIADHPNERVSTSYATQSGLQLIDILAGGGGGDNSNLMALLGVGAQVGILLPFSRTQEGEADLLGLDYMARAGFDPRASVELWQNMAQAGGGQGPEFLSTHPAHGSRIDELQGRMDHALELYRQAQAQGVRPNCPAPR